MNFFHLHPNVQWRLAVNFLTNLTTAAVLPFMAVYFAGRLGNTVVGFMLMVIVLSGIAGGFTGGHYSDKTGRKKLLIVADTVTVVMYVCIAFANSPWYNSPFVTFLLFIIAMFASGIMGPVAQAMIVDVSTPDNRTFIFRISYWAMNLAIAIGGVVGGFLFKAYHFELFLGVSAISLVSLLVTIFLLSESYFPQKVSGEKNTSQKASGGLRSIFSGYGVVMKDKIFMFYVISGVLLLSLEQQLTNYIGIELNQRVSPQVLFSIGSFQFHVDGIKMLGFLRTENTLFVVLFTVLVSVVVKRFSNHWVFYIGAGLFSIGYFMLGMSANPWILFIAMIVISTGEVMYSPVKQTYLASIASGDRRSSYMAVNGLSFYVAMLVAAMFVSLGAIVPFWVTSGLFLVMGGASLYLFHRILPGLDERKRLEKGA